MDKEKDNKLLEILKNLGENIRTIAIEAEAANKRDFSPPIVRAFLDIPQADKDKQEAHEKRGEARDIQRTDRDRRRLYLEAAGLGFVIALAAMTVYQSQQITIATNAAVVSADEASRANYRSAVESSNALREARTQADIAQQSINTTVEQFRLDQRAWLFPSQPEQPILHAPGQVTGGIFVIRNSGKTVAKQVQVRNVMLRVVHTNASKNWIDLKLHEGLIGSADFKVIFPSQDTPKFATVLTSGYGSLSHEQIENLHRGESFLALSGTLKYSDVYNVQHRTRFCFYWLYLLNPAPSIDIHRNQSETVPSAVMACTQYNDVDTNSRTERKRSSPAR